MTWRVKAPGAAANGRGARAAGERAEAAVEAACAAYARQGLALVERLHAPVAVCGPVTGGAFRARWVGGAPVDFAGTLRGGRSVRAEVKTDGGVSLALETGFGPRLRPEQADSLQAHHDAGALVAVLVRLGPTPELRRRGVLWRWYALPWAGWLAAVEDAAAAGRKSLPAEALEQHGRVCPVVRGWPDWLAALGVVA
jgi:hypothetical protein